MINKIPELLIVNNRNYFLFFLTHARFHNPAREPSLDYDVILPVDDDIQLSVTQYRNKLYEVGENFSLATFSFLWINFHLCHYINACFL